MANLQIFERTDTRNKIKKERRIDRMKMPKYDQTIQVDNWICCWCGKKIASAEDLDLHKSGVAVNCPFCGKVNMLYFSVEYMAMPEEENENES